MVGDLPDLEGGNDEIESSRVHSGTVHWQQSTAAVNGISMWTTVFFSGLGVKKTRGIITPSAGKVIWIDGPGDKAYLTTSNRWGLHWQVLRNARFAYIIPGFFVCQKYSASCAGYGDGLGLT